MVIRCLCIDDEPLARQGIELALAPYEDFQLVGQFSSADEALNSTISNIDIIFLDIEMPRKNGFAMLKEWQGSLPLIVFVTAHDKYAIKAFEQQALDYVLKPIDERRFVDVIEKSRLQISQKSQSANAELLLETIEKLQKQIAKGPKSVTVKTDDGYFRVNINQIIYIESVGDHVCIHLQEQQLITRQTLKHYIAEFADYGFYQVHKSRLVNAEHVQQAIKLRFSDYELVMTNKVSIRLSRRYNSTLSHLIA